MRFWNTEANGTSKASAPISAPGYPRYTVINLDDPVRTEEYNKEGHESPRIKPSHKEPKKKTKKFPFTTNDIFDFIQDQYAGDITELMSSVSGILTIGSTSGLIKSPKAKKALKATQGVIGAALFGLDLYKRIDRYVRSRTNEECVSDGRSDHIKSVLGEDWSTCGFISAKNVISWALAHPETSELKIIKYYDMVEYKEVKSIPDTLSEIGLLIKFPNDRLGLWYLDVVKFGTFISCRTSTLYLSGIIPDPEVFMGCQALLNKEYISSLDIAHNTLRFSGNGSYISMEPVPRKVINTTIYNFAYDEFLSEIRTILSCNRRRAYAFVGLPGTGKSSIIRKIESAIPEYPMVYFSASEFENAETLRSSFQMLKTIGPCIAVIEDLDSYGLKDKNRISGTFLECIDEVNENTNMVLLVTINETSQVHGSIIDRPGRFDRIIEVKPPQTIHEIVSIMNYKIEKLSHEYFEGIVPYVLHGENPLVIECLNKKYTQAEIVNAIAEEIVLNIKTKALELPVSDEVFYSEMKKSMNNLEQSKGAIKAYAE